MEKRSCDSPREVTSKESVQARVSSPGNGARERAGDKGRSQHSCKRFLHEIPYLGREAKAHPAGRARGRVGDLTAFSWAEILKFADEFVSSARPLIKNIGGCLVPEGYSQ